jgi:hypothetical protein
MQPMKKLALLPPRKMPDQTCNIREQKLIEAKILRSNFGVEQVRVNSVDVVILDTDLAYYCARTKDACTWRWKEFGGKYYPGNDKVTKVV